MKKAISSAVWVVAIWTSSSDAVLIWEIFSNQRVKLARYRYQSKHPCLAFLVHSATDFEVKVVDFAIGGCDIGLDDVVINVFQSDFVLAI